MQWVSPGMVMVGVGLLVLLIGEGTGRRLLVWIAKPAASLGFLVLAWEQGAFQSSYGILLFVGLCLCLAGDLLLIPKARSAFLAGLGAFLLGHVAYALAFGFAGAKSSYIIVALLLLLPVRLLVLRWLGPHLPEKMKLPVEAYAAVITLMLAFSTGLLPVRGPLALAGAFLFYLSDLSVARDRFVSHSFVNRAWGLPAYYGGQVLLALSIS